MFFFIVMNDFTGILFLMDKTQRVKEEEWRRKIAIEWKSWKNSFAGCRENENCIYKEFFSYHKKRNSELEMPKLKNSWNSRALKCWKKPIKVFLSFDKSCRSTLIIHRNDTIRRGEENVREKSSCRFSSFSFHMFQLSF